MEDVPVGISLIYIISNNLINRRRGFNRALKRERERERSIGNRRTRWNLPWSRDTGNCDAFMRALWVIWSIGCNLIRRKTFMHDHVWLFFFFSLAKSIDGAKRKRIYSIGLSIIFKLYLVSY